MSMSEERKTTTVRAVIYTRISLDRTGDEAGVQRQEEACRTIAREKGWEVVKVYTDNSRSAYDRKTVRPGYQQMWRDHEEGRFDAIICWKLDRLARRLADVFPWINDKQERDNGELVKPVLIATYGDNLDLSNDIQRGLALLLITMAEAEMKTKGDRQKLANRQRLSQGNYPRNIPVPTGYRRMPDGKLEQVPELSQAVNAVFHAFATGSAVKAIARSLGTPMEDRPAGDPRFVSTVPCIPPPGKSARLSDGSFGRKTASQWLDSTVTSMLKQPVYAGWAMLNGEHVRDRDSGQPVIGEWEPIITDGVFRAAQERFEGRKTHAGKRERKALGAGLYLCGVCGSKVRSHDNSYQCPHHVMRIRQPVDDLVFAVVSEYLSRPAFRGLLAEDTEPEAERIRTEIQRFRDKIARYKYFADQPDSDPTAIDDYVSARQRWQPEIESLNRQLASLSIAPDAAMIAQADDPAAAFMSADLGLKRTIIASLITVTIQPYPTKGGRRAFDPAYVSILPVMKSSPRNETVEEEQQ